MDVEPVSTFHSPDPIHNLEIRVLLRRVGVTDRVAASRAKKRQKAAKKTSKAKRRKKKKRRAAEGSSDDDAAEKEADGSVEAEAGSSDDYSGSESESESDGEGSEASSASKKGARSGAGLVPPGVVFSRVFKWQEKAFSPWELMRYHSMCRADRLSENGRLLPESATGNNEEYREEMEEWLKEGLDPLSLLQPAMLFSYVDNDGFIPESERDEVTTDSAPPLLVAEMVTPVEHYRAKSRRGFIDEDVHRAVHADRGMVAQTMYIMAAVEIDTESFKRTAEDHAVQQPLCMIRAFPSSTRVDMQPRFSKAPIVIPALMRGGAAGAPAAAPAAGGAEGADSAEQQQSARVEWYRFSTARGVYEYRVENNSGPTAGVYPQFVRPAKAEIAPSGGAGAAEAATEDAAAREAKEAADRATGLVDLLNFDAKRVASDTKREVQLRELASLLDEEDHRRDREATASMIARTAAPFRGPVHANECHIFCNVELMSASGYAGGVERMCVARRARCSTSRPHSSQRAHPRTRTPARGPRSHALALRTPRAPAPSARLHACAQVRHGGDGSAADRVEVAADQRDGGEGKAGGARRFGRPNEARLHARRRGLVDRCCALRSPHRFGALVATTGGRPRGSDHVPRLRCRLVRLPASLSMFISIASCPLSLFHRPFSLIRSCLSSPVPARRSLTLPTVSSSLSLSLSLSISLSLVVLTPLIPARSLSSAPPAQVPTAPRHRLRVLQRPDDAYDHGGHRPDVESERAEHRVARSRSARRRRQDAERQRLCRHAASTRR